MEMKLHLLEERAAKDFWRCGKTTSIPPRCSSQKPGVGCDSSHFLTQPPCSVADHIAVEWSHSCPSCTVPNWSFASRIDCSQAQLLPHTFGHGISWPGYLLPLVSLLGLGFFQAQLRCRVPREISAIPQVRVGYFLVGSYGTLCFLRHHERLLSSPARGQPRGPGLRQCLVHSTGLINKSRGHKGMCQTYRGQVFHLPGEVTEHRSLGWLNWEAGTMTKPRQGWWEEHTGSVCQGARLGPRGICREYRFAGRRAQRRHASFL
ncbi:uncharacterized protein LOC122211532 [Panthera leo]|uniref:uncharacterized protein LOC122211532 n=1 Tax=Panthera leo TaxID=9689 RepID=UPI001C6A87BC|nr:uncharacterized protein LOC122211532 [Panthera leo]